MTAGAALSRQQRRAAARAGRRNRRRGGPLQRAQNCIRAGRTEEAARILENIPLPSSIEGGLVLGRLHKDIGNLQGALEILEALYARAPEHAEVLFELGDTAHRLGMTDGEVAFFSQYVKQNPEDPAGYAALGSALRAKGEFAASAEIYKAGLARHPHEAALWHGIGTTMMPMADAENAEIFFREAVRLDPGLAEAWANLGDLLYALDQAEEGYTCFKKAIALKPDNGRIAFNFSMCLLLDGRLEEAWQYYEGRLSPGFPGLPRRDIDLPRWQGEDISDKTLLVLAEQGVGDELMFSTLFADAISRAGRTIIECDERLQTLFSRSFPDAEFHPWRGEGDVSGKHRHYDWLAETGPADIMIEEGSLFGLFRRRIGDFPADPPLLKADPARLEKWRRRLGELGTGLKVGLSWRSIRHDPGRIGHYPAIAELAPLLMVPGVQFVSLQYGDTEDEISMMEEQLGISIARWQDLDLKDDFEETAALTANLDLVIAPTNAARVLAACMGRPGWVMSPGPAPFNLGQQRCPFMPSLTDYTKPPGPDWSPVIAAMTADLQKLAGDDSIITP